MRFSSLHLLLSSSNFDFVLFGILFRWDLLFHFRRISGFVVLNLGQEIERKERTKFLLGIFYGFCLFLLDFLEKIDCNSVAWQAIECIPRFVCVMERKLYSRDGTRVISIWFDFFFAVQSVSYLNTQLTICFAFSKGKPRQQINSGRNFPIQNRAKVKSPIRSNFLPEIFCGLNKKRRL